MELHNHMMKEERVLFPYIGSLVAASSGTESVQRPSFGSAQNPIRMMEAEHQAAGDALYEIRKLSSN
jgi:regulator of cell morphogenesis and NO signaling